MLFLLTLALVVRFYMLMSVTPLPSTVQLAMYLFALILGGFLYRWAR